MDGAIYVNTQWGGVDENGDPAGSAAGPPYAMSCMPLLPLTRVYARDIRVVGGVDDQKNYGAFDAQESNPLHANLLPVDDPLENLPPPSIVSDASNVTTAVQSPSDAVRVALSVGQANTLTDGVASSLSAFLRHSLRHLFPSSQRFSHSRRCNQAYTIRSRCFRRWAVKFAPGVYIIRGKSPLTNMSLCILGPVDAEGVLFYITDSTTFDASNGEPDASDASDSCPRTPLRRSRQVS